MSVLFEKARENYRVAQDAFDDARYNAAASRLYYALRQACVDKLTRNGTTFKAFDTSAEKWTHTLLIRAARAERQRLGLSKEHIVYFQTSRELREKADYAENERVEKGDIRRIIDSFQEILDLLG